MASQLERKINQVRARQAAEQARIAKVEATHDIDLLPPDDQSSGRRILAVVGWCAWVIAAWLIASFLTSFVIVLIQQTTQLNLLKSVAGSAVSQLLLMIVTLWLVLAVPYRLGRAKGWSKAKRRMSKMRILGLSRLPQWSDVQATALGVVAYYGVALVCSFVISQFLPPSVMQQVQDVGFVPTSDPLQTVIIVLVLAAATPVFEELIFRGFLLGKLQPQAGFWLSAIIVSLLFAVAHGQINVALVTFILSMVSCYLRQSTGAIWSSIGLHAFVNLIAVTLVFVIGA